MEEENTGAKELDLTVDEASAPPRYSKPRKKRWKNPPQEGLINEDEITEQKVNEDSTTIDFSNLTTDSSEFRPPIDVIARKDEIISAFQSMFRYAKTSDSVKRNQEYVESSIDKLVLPIWGDLLDKENGVDMRRADVNRYNAQLIGNGIGSTKQDFLFNNSVAIGPEAFRHAQFGNISGSCVVGDFALCGDYTKPKRDNRGRPIPQGDMHIDNSVIFGSDVLADQVNGSIKNSIVGITGGILKQPNLEVENTYFVTDHEVFYVKKGRFTYRGLPGLPAIRTPIETWKKEVLSPTS